jgi:hypothetical protein
MYRDKLKIIISIALIFLVLSCKNELINDNKFIQNLSDDIDFELPMVNESLMIFIKKNDVVFITSLRKLYSIKEKEYKEFKDFDSFLIEVINNDLLSREKLEVNSISSFELNNAIVDEYKKKGLNHLKDVYCERCNSNKNLYIKTSLDLNEKKTIMYLFFKNNYYVGEDDYLGKYILIDKN